MTVIVPVTGLTDSFDSVDAWALNEYGDTNADHTCAISTAQYNTSSGKSLLAHIPASHTDLQGSRRYFTLANVETGAAMDVSFFLYIDPSSQPSNDSSISICRIICTGSTPLDLCLRRNAEKQWRVYYNVTGGDDEHAPYSHLTAGAWHQIRWRLNGFGVGTIVAEVWVDGIKVWWSNDTQVSNAEGSVAADQYPTQLWMGIVRYTPGAIGDSIKIYLDDVRMSNSGDLADLPSVATLIPLITSDTTVSVTITSPVALAAGNSFLEYGPTTAYGSSAYGYTVSGVGTRAMYFSLQGLVKGTTYHYRFSLEDEIGENIITTGDFSFTIPLETTDTTIALVGDIQGLTNRSSAPTILLKDFTPDLNILNGDITDIQDYRAGGGYKTPDGVALPAWADMSATARLAVVDRNAGCLKGLARTGLFTSALGNHDFVGTGTGATGDYLKGFFRVPTTQNADRIWYSFNYGRAHYLILVDMGVWHTSSLSAAVLSEIEADLAFTNAEWKIVVGHYPIYYVPADTWAPYSQAATLHAIFARQNVHLYCGAHRHRFNYVTVDGVAYLINGTGSTSSATDAFNNPAIEGQGSDCLPASSGLWGYTILEVKENEIIIRAYQKTGVVYPIFGRVISKKSRTTATKRTL